MKLLPCTSVVTNSGEYSGENTTGNSSSPPPPPPLHTNLSLQTLPSIPSLQSLTLLDPTTTTAAAAHSLSSPITSLSLSRSHRLYASSGHLINVYDSSTFTHLETFNSDGVSSGSVKGITFADGKILTAHQDGKIKVWKLTEKSRNKRRHHKLVDTLPTLTDKLRRYPLPRNHVHVTRHKRRLWIEHNDAVSSLAVTSDAVSGKSVIYSVSWDKTLKMWGGGTGFKCMDSLTAHDDAVNSVIVSKNGVIFTGSADGRIRVWAKPGSERKRNKTRLIATLEKHKSGVNALALNNDGWMLFSGACDRWILVWEREESGKYMSVSGALRGHYGAILCLINVCDFLISGSGDRTVRIWRRGFDGQFCCLTVLTGHLKPVKSLVGEMDCGEGILTLFSGSLDGEIKVWKVNVNYDYNCT